MLHLKAQMRLKAEKTRGDVVNLAGQEGVLGWDCFLPPIRLGFLVQVNHP